MFLQIIVFFLLAFAAETSSDLIFLKDGQKLQSLSLESIKKSKYRQSVSVYEPVEKRQRVYQGVSVLSLLDSIYGSAFLKKMDTVVFYCEDGYRSDVPLEKFQKTKAFLLFAAEDKEGFVLKSPDNQKKISLGPYYLAWDRPRSESINGKVFPWPYGIHKIDVIQSSVVYAALKESTTADKIIKGHQEFMNHCFSCHQFNGVGGLRGPPLNFYVNSKQKTELVKFILNPKSFSPNSQMSGLPLDLPERTQTAEAIVDYLKLTQKSMQ